MDRFATCGHSCGATRGAAWGRRVGGASSLCEGEAGAAASAPSPCGGAGVRRLVGPAVLFVSCWVLKRFGW